MTMVVRGKGKPCGALPHDPARPVRVYAASFAKEGHLRFLKSDAPVKEGMGIVSPVISGSYALFSYFVSLIIEIILLLYPGL